MKETTFTQMLERISFPPHVPTFKAAIEGRPLPDVIGEKRGKWLTPPMEKEDALRLARMAMWYIVLRAWKEYKNTDEWGAKGLKRYTAKKRKEKKWKSETLALMKLLEELGDHYIITGNHGTVTVSIPYLPDWKFEIKKL